MLDKEILGQYRDLWKEKLEIAVKIATSEERQSCIIAEMAKLEDRILEILEQQNDK